MSSSFLLSLITCLGAMGVLETTRYENDVEDLPRGAMARLGTLHFRHLERISSLAFSPNGKLVVSGSWDKSVSVWDLDTGRQIRKLDGDKWFVSAVAISATGDLIASAGGEEFIKLWNAKTGKEISRLGGEEFDLLAFSPANNCLAAAGKKSGVHLWRIPSGKEIQLPRKVNDRVVSMSFSPNGMYLALGIKDRFPIIWDLEKKMQVSPRKGMAGNLGLVAILPNGKEMAIVSRSGDHLASALITRIETGEVVRKLSVGWDWISSLALSPNGEFLATLCDARPDRKVVDLWEMSSGTLVGQIKSSGDFSCLCFSPDGKILATGGDRAICFWKVQARTDDDSDIGQKEGRPAPTFRRQRVIPELEELGYEEGHHGEVSSLSFSSDGRYLATGGRDSSVIIWNMSEKKAKQYLPGHEWDKDNFVRFCPNRLRLFTGGGSASWAWEFAQGAWELPFGEGKYFFGSRIGEFKSVDISNDGKIVAAALASSVRDPQTLSFFSEKRGKVTLKFKSLENINAVVFSTDSRILAAGGKDLLSEAGVLYFFDVSTEKLLNKFLLRMGGIRSLAFSPNGKVIAVAGETRITRDSKKGEGTRQESRPIILLNPDTGKELRSLTGHNGDVFAVAFSNEGKMLATAGEDKTIRFWDFSTGKQITTIKGHVGSVKAIAFSPDDRILASGSADTTIVLWDVRRVLGLR